MTTCLFVSDLSQHLRSINVQFAKRNRQPKDSSPEGELMRLDRKQKRKDKQSMYYQTRKEKERKEKEILRTEAVERRENLVGMVVPMDNEPFHEIESSGGGEARSSQPHSRLRSGTTRYVSVFF